MHILDSTTRKRWFTPLALLALVALTAGAQESDLTISVGGAYELSIFENTITLPHPIDQDPMGTAAPLDQATIRGYALHAALSYRILPWLELATRLGRTKSGASFTSQHLETQVLLQGQPEPVTQIVEMRHTFGMELWRLDLLARTKLPLGDLTCELGATVGSRRFDSIKTRYVLIEPQNARFQNPTQFPEEEDGRVLVVYNDTWPESNPLIIGLTAGLSYPVSIFDRLSIVPDLKLRYEPTMPDNDEEWPSYFASGGISLSYAFGEIAPMVGQTPPPPEPSSLTAELDLYSVDAMGRRLPHVKVFRGDLELVRQVFPARTLYFDHGSAAIPERHSARAGSSERFKKPWEIAQLPVDEGYYHLLDLIGYRMTSMPRGRLFLHAGRRGDEPATIARARGESVRRFMVERWKIAPAMIEIVEEGTEPAVKLEMEAVGREDIVAAWNEGYFETTPVKVDPAIASGIGVKSWRITFMQNGKILAQQGSDSARGDLNLAMLLGDVKDGELPPPIVAELTAEDVAGGRASVMSTLPFVRDERAPAGDSVVMTFDLFEQAALAGADEIDIVAHHIVESRASTIQVTVSPLLAGPSGADVSMTERLDAIAARLRRAALKRNRVISIEVTSNGALAPRVDRLPEDAILRGAVRIVMYGRAS